MRQLTYTVAQLAPPLPHPLTYISFSETAKFHYTPSFSPLFKIPSVTSGRRRWLSRDTTEGGRGVGITPELAFSKNLRRRVRRTISDPLFHPPTSPPPNYARTLETGQRERDTTPSTSHPSKKRTYSYFSHLFFSSVFRHASPVSSRQRGKRLSISGGAGENQKDRKKVSDSKIISWPEVCFN